MHEQLIISKVTKNDNYFSISTENGVGFGMPTKYKVTPKAGDKITLHSVNGSTIRGIDLNGKKVFYKSDAQLNKEHKQWCDNNKKEKKAQFKKDKPRLDAIYNKLPKCFKDRIDKLRTNNPDFREDFENYELFCCEQAIIIANGCKTADAILKFTKKKWKDQKKMVPKLDSGHSGNTFGVACSLAYWYLEQPQNVTKMHGALSPLVGSKAYGDIAKKKGRKK